jgi:hypothetical protein
MTRKILTDCVQVDISAQVNIWDVNGGFIDFVTTTFYWNVKEKCFVFLNMTSGERKLELTSDQKEQITKTAKKHLKKLNLPVVLTDKDFKCDGCDKIREDIKSVGRDANGEPDAPDLCFICRKESDRGRIYDKELRKYVRWNR